MSQTMKVLTLDDLPTPPPDKTGWPWTEQSDPLPNQMPDGSEWPRISIITPSYNQGEFIEETIRSVLLQGYPKLEYIIIDGGSTDNTLAILEKYQDFFAYYVSEKDRGQSHAINKGLAKATGEYVAWMNSDDCYLSNALNLVSQKLATQKVDFIYSNKGYSGSEISDSNLDISQMESLQISRLIRSFLGWKYVIPSQSALISKNLLKQVGPLDESLHYCMDIDWFIRISFKRPDYVCLDKPISFYRIHSEAKTSSNKGLLLNESIEVAKKNSKDLSGIEKFFLRNDIGYCLAMEKFRGKINDKNNLVNLLKIAFLFPFGALRDRFFWGSLRRVLIRI